MRLGDSNAPWFHTKRYRRALHAWLRLPWAFIYCHVGWGLAEPWLVGVWVGKNDDDVWQVTLGLAAVSVSIDVEWVA